jgi:acyl-CoA synthetase (NDP forming)/RimJ/RimL family protein N-acetyltransferase
MAMLPAPPGKFRPEFLFRPGSVVLTGADSPAGQQVRVNLAASAFPGEIHTTPAGADLAVICALDGPIAPVFAALAARGTRTAIVLCLADGVGEAAKSAGIRALGPGSFGIAVPRLGLNATRGHLAPRPGRLALVSQSAALCRVVLDWAEPNGIGFSTIAGIGGNADIGFGLVLDWLSRDPDTGAILLDIRHIRDPRRFISAARAAARLRPVVAIRAGTRLADPGGLADAAFDAVLRRCGVLGVSTLADLLAAAETLTRARPARGERLAIVTNATGPARLAADAALRDGFALARLPTGEAFRHADPDDPARLAALAAECAAMPEVGGILVVHAPTGPADTAAIDAIAAAGTAMKTPLLACAMGQTTGEPHRRRLADAAIPAFATPEEAVRGFLHLVQHRRIRAAARELPDSAVPDLHIQAATAAALLAAAPAGPLPPDTAAALLAAYGIATGPEPGLALRVALGNDPMFGPILAFGSALAQDRAIDLPPLNRALAETLIAQTAIAAQIAMTPNGPARTAELLERASQLIVDHPRITGLDLALHLDAHGIRAAAAITLSDTPRPPLAIPPYPSEWVRTHQAGAETFTLRPIRPEDAAAHAEFFARLSPEDVRYRFFSAIRALSTEQIARLTQVDYAREMALIATDAAGATVGVARLVREMDTGTAEFAIVVQASAKGRGLATALMRQLIAWGRAQGVRLIEGQVLADNAPMLAFIRKLGFTVRRNPAERDIMDAHLALPPQPAP